MRKSEYVMFIAVLSAAIAMSGCLPARPSSADLDTYVKSRDLYLRGSLDEAAALVSRIESRIKGFHQARLLEGKIFFFQGNMEASERVFQDLSKRFKGYPEAQLWLLRALLAQGKTEKAELLLSEVLEKNPGDPRFLHQAGLLRLAADDISGALAYFRRSQEYATEFSQSYIETARILYRFGLLDSALVDLATASSLLPPDSNMRKPVSDLEKRIREGKK